MKQINYSIRLLRPAEDDLTEIISYISIDNPSAAETLAEKIENKLLMLSDHPLLGKIPKEEELAKMGYRFLIVQNYLIFYTVEQQIIWIHRIIHGARDYLRLL
jgi:toxin ParE1/3/4